MSSAEVFKDFDYVALGHPQTSENGRETLRYSGTPLKYSFRKQIIKSR